MAKRKNHEIAMTVINHDDYKKNLIWCEGWELFYLYNGTHYEILPINHIHKKIHYLLSTEETDKSLNITASMVKDVTTQISWLCHRQVDEIIATHISFKDCLLNTTTFKTTPHSHEHIATLYLPYNYSGLHQPAPTFTKFLNEILPDKDIQTIIQEMFGNMFMDTMLSNTAFFLTGSGSNGKSTLTDILQQTIGYKHVSSLSIQVLTTERFATSHLVGKTLNIVNEEESKFMRTDKFKNLITGESISAERKFGNMFEFKPRTRFIFNTNEPPTFEGLGYALKRRLIIIPFTQKFIDSKQRNIMNPDEKIIDKNIPKKLFKELPGIVYWALEGAKRLHANNYTFSTSKATSEALRTLEEESSSAVEFIRECYETDSTNMHWTANTIIYDDYKKWCEDNGRKPMNNRNFLKSISNSDDTITGEKKYKSGEGTVRSKNLRRLKISPTLPPPNPEL